ncbi:hypothetical protein N2152v2_000919 [Parachlorella kessleri]
MADSQSSPKDRFEVPKGSLHFSNAGTLSLGMLDKPSLRVLRWDYEAAKQAENEVLQERMNSAPAGRRHDAFYLYLANVRAEERAKGFNASWERAAERCRRTQRLAHLGTSTDNFLAWKHDDPEGSSRPSTPRPGTLSPQERPQTAPPSMSPTSWNMWNQPIQAASSPRFQARAAFEHKRCTTPDMDDVKKRTYAKIAAQRTAERQAQQDREVLLAAKWPHGMSATARREAAQQGIVAAGLGYGFPLSLPNRQYEALKPGMKWY